MRTKAERGIFPCCAPPGYRNVEVGNEKMVVPDPHTAPKVARLFVFAARKGASLRRLASEAEAMGLRSRNGKAVNAPALRLILANPFYVGTVRYGGATRTGLHEPEADHWEAASTARLFAPGSATR